MTMGENKGELHGGESSRHATSPPTLVRIGEGLITDETEKRQLDCSESDGTIGVELLEWDTGGSDSLSEDNITDLYDFLLWYHFDFCSLRSNNFNSASNSRRRAFRATISSVRLSHAL